MNTFFPLFGYIYLVTFPNGKVYIGQKLSPVFLSWYWGSGALLPDAFARHGRENCTIEILSWCATQESLNAAEIQMIDEYNSRDRKFGYNLASGGHLISGDTHEETKEKLRQANRSENGRVLSPITSPITPAGSIGPHGWIGITVSGTKYRAQIHVYDPSYAHHRKQRPIGGTTRESLEEAAKDYDELLDEHYPDTPDENRNFIDGKRNPRCVKTRLLYGARFRNTASVLKAYQSIVTLHAKTGNRERSQGYFAYKPLAAIVSDMEKIRRKLHLCPSTKLKLSYPELLEEPHLQTWKPEAVLDYLVPDWKDDKHHCVAYVLKYKKKAV